MGYACLAEPLCPADARPLLGLARRSRALDHHKSLEVLAFRKGLRYRVVGRGARAGVGHAINTRIELGAGADLVEQIGANAARARKREQQPDRLQRDEGEAIDILVGARSIASSNAPCESRNMAKSGARAMTGPRSPQVPRCRRVGCRTAQRRALRARNGLGRYKPSRSRWLPGAPSVEAVQGLRKN